MKWTFKLNGKQVTWEIADNLVAIPPSPDFKPAKNEFPKTPSKREGNNGYEQKRSNYNGYKPKRSDLDREIYERAGWRFVDPAQAGTADVRKVFFTERDDLLIETKLATVQLAEPGYPQATPEKILAEDGLEIVQRLSFAPNLFSVRVSKRPLRETIDRLQKKTDRYVFAEPSMIQTITGRFTPSEPDFLEQWQHARVFNVNNGTGGRGLNSIDAWNYTKGKGPAPARPVRVAVIDNGMDINHVELKPAIIGGGSFSSTPGSGTADFVRIEAGMTGFPPDGHGTLCLGMVGARNNGQGGCGVAPECDLIAIACANDQTGTQLTLARAIQFAVSPLAVDPEGVLETGADIISCSLRTASFLERVLQLAIDGTATGRGGLGVPLFWAVSNEEDDLISEDPVCSLENVIAIGSSKPNGTPAGSAKGTKLEFIAPGENVYGPGFGPESVRVSGTSFATPMAAGVAALILARNPNWTGSEVRQRMRVTCDRQPNGGGPDPEYGFGRLNAYKAVRP